MPHPRRLSFLNARNQCRTRGQPSEREQNITLRRNSASLHRSRPMRWQSLTILTFILGCSQASGEDVSTSTEALHSCKHQIFTVDHYVDVAAGVTLHVVQK